MRELDYRPNVSARALVTGRSKTLGVISVNTTLYGPASTLYGIEVAARAAGYFVRVATLRTGAARATQHLLSLDHQTVWHIAGPREWLEARAREAAWRATLVQAGRTPPPVLVGDWSARTGYQHGRTLASRDDATAIFVANDQMALGVLRAVNQARLDVPGDISVVGFDDVPEAAYFVPPLTTVRQDFGAVGRHSLEVLLQQVEGGSPRTDPVVIAPDLVLRESTGGPGSG